MKKIIIVLLVLHASLLTFHAATAQQAGEPVFTHSVVFFESLPIREMPVVLPGAHEKEQRIIPNKFKYSADEMESPSLVAKETILQKNQGQRQGKGPILNFEGVGNVNANYPADPNGDVGLNHYVQSVNSSFAVWDKSGSLLYGPVDYQTIWSSFPGPWNSYYWCDPVFKYDNLADRWIMTSMSYDFVNFYTMIAVSSTPDPLGSYYCYAFYFADMNDYPKLSVWPDGYYMSHNFWNYEDDIFLYTLYSVADREAMLNGEPVAGMIQFQVLDEGEWLLFPLPADLRGPMVPDSAPCYYVKLARHESGNPWHLYLDVLALDTDWDVPGNSTLEQIAQFDLGQFEPLPYPYGPGSPQQGSDINVMTLPLILMYPLTYRKFTDHEALVCCHTVYDVDVHYIKWYELRNEGSGWDIYQTGNYAPDGAHYFMPSISMNGNGDLALGYSACSAEMHPSIHFTGRLAEDTPGLMTFQELELFKGLNYSNNYQSGYGQNRWGDYSSMMVDPADDSTFWYTNMYTKATTTLGNWATRIFSLDLSEDIGLPYAHAGNDTLTCNLLFFETQGEAENFSSIIWTTSGDGNFISNYSENATYLRGPGDLQNEQVTLTLNLTGYLTGSSAKDSMILYLNKDPEVHAGEDVTIFADEPVVLEGEVLYAYDHYWETTGDGSFSDSSQLDAIYIPGPGDIENEQVILILTAFEVSPCNGSIDDSLTVFILHVGIEDYVRNEMGLKLFPNPTSAIITVQSTLPSQNPVTIQVIESSGEIIFTGRFTAADRNFEKQFDLSYLKQGVYFIRLQAGEEVVTGKMMVRR